jgi:hypothetical protein
VIYLKYIFHSCVFTQQSLSSTSEVTEVDRPLMLRSVHILKPVVMKPNKQRVELPSALTYYQSLYIHHSSKLGLCPNLLRKNCITVEWERLRCKATRIITLR